MERFTLYKKENDKWVQYSGGEVYTVDLKSLRYQQALRLVSRGWIAYRMKNIPGIHPPLVLEGSYDELEKLIKESDPITEAVGKSMKEFVNKQERAKMARQTISKDLIHERALKQALIDYQANRYVLPHLLEELGIHDH